MILSRQSCSAVFRTAACLAFAALLPAMAWGALLAALPFPGSSSYPDGMTARPPINGNLVVAGVIFLSLLPGIISFLRSRSQARG